MRRVDKQLPDGFFIRERCDGTQFGQQPRRGDVQRFVFIAVQFRVKAGQRHHHGRKHRHRVGVFGVAAEKGRHVLVDHGVQVQQVGKLLAFPKIGEIAENEQVSHFDKLTMLAEVFD